MQSTFIILIVIIVMFALAVFVGTGRAKDDRSDAGPAKRTRRACEGCGCINKPKARYCAQCGRELDRRA